MTAPEPWREVQGHDADGQPYALQPEPRRRRAQRPDRLVRDKSQRETETEFGWGKGLVSPSANGAPPDEGGIYMPKAPPVDEAGRPVARRRGEARGNPGVNVAR